MTSIADGRVPLRQRQRDATRDRLIHAAVELFERDGFEATTVEAIADAAAVSPRTFFRYFGTKEGVILSKFDDTGDRLADALRDRPAGEAPWRALRRMFDEFVAYTEDADLMRQSNALNGIIARSDGLRAGYLERMARMQVLATEVLRERSELSEIEARSLVAAAFACLTLAGSEADQCTTDFGRALDQAMAAVEKHVATAPAARAFGTPREGEA